MASTPQITLDPAEWDFRKIPENEWEIAMVYEYCREVPEVRQCIERWLKSEEKRIDEGYNEDGHYRDVSGIGVSVRQSLIDQLNTGGYVWDEEEWAPSQIWDHRVWPIRYVLTEWPKPYLVAKQCSVVAKGIAETEKRDREKKREPLSAYGQIRQSNREECHLKRRFGGLIAREFFDERELPTYAFDIDMRFTAREIQAAFNEWLKRERTKLKAGRPRGANWDTKLKSLSALRLVQRGSIKKKLKHAEIKLAVEGYQKDNPFEGVGAGGELLPLYGPSGFSKAEEEAQKLKREFLQYREWDEEAGKTVIKHIDEDSLK